MTRPEVYTTHTAAKLCRVTPMTVIRWVDEGRIKAFRTPGGHRRILRQDLEDFCRGAGIPLEDAPESKNRIIIVDDEPIIVDLLSDVIRGLGEDFEVSSATNGYEAGRLVATVRPQLVFLDLKMPGVDGFAVCQSIKSDPATSETEVVAVTGHFTEENVQRILSCGASRVLRKPIDLDVVRALVRESFGMTEPAVAPKRRPARRARRRRLLLVAGEDGRATVLGGAAALGSAFEVGVALGGLDALVQVGRDRPEVVVVDAGIRDVEVTDLCEQIRRSDAERVVNLIVVLEPGATDAQRSLLRAAGATLVSERPATVDTLVAASTPR